MAVTIRCVYWEDFARLSKDAEIAIYEINGLNALFRVYAIKENILIYEEPLPFPEKIELEEHRRRRGAKAHENAFSFMEQDKFTVISRQVVTKTLRCGLSYSVTPRLVREGSRWIAEFEYKFDPSAVSKFLSLELKTSMDRIVEGNLLKVA
jgi:hypothetical protein